MRFVAPLIAGLAAFYVYSANQGATNEFVFLFPMNLVFDEPAEAGRRSWQLLLGVALLWLLADLRALAVRSAARDEGAED